MSGGGKTIVINQNERAVSSDVNRLQELLVAGIAEPLRYLLGTNMGTDDLDAAGLDNETTTSTAPSTAEIMGGLLVQPQIASLNMLVTAGSVAMVDPDSSPSADDSPNKLVVDAGVQTLGNLVAVANPAGSVRVDVVECQRQVVVVETDARDIFNPNTGLYTTTPVTKVAGSKLAYRVRQGVAGSGFPGVAQGWLPLCVISAAAGATTCDQMDFWDVRPLLSDRHPSIQAAGYAHMRRLGGHVDSTVPTATSLAFEASAQIPGNPTAGRRIGGEFVGTIDLTSAKYQDPNLAADATSGAFVTLALVFPQGLPRWARYTPSTSGQRKPQGPRGIPCLTAAGFCQDGTGYAAGGSPVLPTPPAFTGLTATETCFFAAFDTIWSGAGTRAVVGSDRGLYSVANAPTHNMSGGGTSTATQTLTTGVDFPASAKSILVRLQATLTGTAASIQASISKAGGGAAVYSDFSVQALESGDLLSMTVELPITTVANYTAGVYTVTMSAGGSGIGTFTTPQLNLLGWRY